MESMDWIAKEKSMRSIFHTFSDESQDDWLVHLDASQPPSGLELDSYQQASNAILTAFDFSTSRTDLPNSNQSRPYCYIFARPIVINDLCGILGIIPHEHETMELYPPRPYSSDGGNHMISTDVYHSAIEQQFYHCGLPLPTRVPGVVSAESGAVWSSASQPSMYG